MVAVRFSLRRSSETALVHSAVDSNSHRTLSLQAGVAKECDDRRPSMKPSSDLQVQLFEPSSILYLDLSTVGDAVAETFSTGCLPGWVRNFTNLRVLKAVKCGILIIEPWIVELTQLREIDLEQNSISTWPHFLRHLPQLEYICLDGNPCLEQAVRKSPTLRLSFFSFEGTEKSLKKLPKHIRGPEWPAAQSARLNGKLNAGFGCYCGGIYTMMTPPDLSNNGFLTPLEPCPLQDRLSRNCKPDTHSSYSSASGKSDTSQSMHLRPGWRNTRHSRILMEIFEDIDDLLNRNSKELMTQGFRPEYIPIAHPINGEAIARSGNPCQPKEARAYHLLVSLLLEEQRYCAELRNVMDDFFSSRIHSDSVLNSLNIIFELFPMLCNSHQKYVYPALKQLTSTANGSRGSIEQRAAALSSILAQLQYPYEWYARGLQLTERHLDITTRHPTFYRDPGLKIYVENLTLKLSLHGYFVTGRASVAQAEWPARRRSSDLLRSRPTPQLAHQEQGPVTLWAEKQLKSPLRKVKKHPKEYYLLPLLHMVNCERVFSVLSGLDSRFETVRVTCRRIRNLMVYRRRTSLVRTRKALLSSKFRTTEAAFDRYRWDALVSVVSRSYLEKPILEHKTLDVYDTITNDTASFVKEVFAKGFQRLLRFVCCSGNIQIWDEVFEHLVGTVDRRSIHVRLVKPKDEARVLFNELREVCTVSVKEFFAPYEGMKSDVEEFVDAFSIDKYLY